MSTCKAPSWSSTPVPVPRYDTGAGATLPQLQASAVSACSSGNHASCAQNVAKLAFNAKATSMGRTLPPMPNTINPSFSYSYGPYAYAPIDKQTYASMVHTSNVQVAATNCADTPCCGQETTSCQACTGAGVAALVERL